jgi:Zn-dependent protease
VNRSGIRPSPIFIGLVVVAVVGGFLTTLDSQAAINGGTLLLVIGGWGVSLCLHEFCHAIVAYRGGDWAVRDKGYLTLDIRRYTDPVFSIVLPLLFLLFGGIPLPGGAVWVDHRYLRSRRIESMVSVVGPLSNLALGVILAAVIRTIPLNGIAVFGGIEPVNGRDMLAAALAYLALLQVLAFFINILPIPGLDGWGTIEPWLSPEAKRFGAMVRPWAPMVLFVLLIGVPSVRNGLLTVTDAIFNGVGGNAGLAQLGQDNFLFWQHGF